jgi:NIPSNAP/TAT (twin-arginine translocation) pathway signal sequence
MKRRDFLKTSLAASAAAGLAPALVPAAAAQMNAAPREYYEWRAYRLKPGANHALLDGYLEKALIPALNRLDSKPVGVFTELEPKEDPAVFVLVPHPTLQAFAECAARLEADAGYLRAGADYLQAAKKDAAFVRIDIWLLRAFAGMPQIELPDYSKARKPRLFEVRTYESYSETKARKKVDMFNAGEIEIMKDVKLGPIFFGEALAGSGLPHLTYMLSAENRDEHQQHFAGFGKHPKWKTLSGDPQYKDTVSKSLSKFLQPTAWSQI